MDDKVDHKLIRRFFDKECTIDEARKVILWLRNSENKEEVEVLLKTRWEETKEADKKGTDFNRLYANILEEIANDKLETKTKAIPYMKLYRAIAAGVAIFLVAVGTVLYFIKPAASVETSQFIVKATNQGERLTTKLPDGTTVTLNSLSSISFPKNFDSNERRVLLTGEAYFNVSKEIYKPFIVKSGPVETKALGTAFNVRSDPGSNMIAVSLTEGKVIVNSTIPDDFQDYYLAPGDEIQYTAEGRYIGKHTFDYQATVGWKDGILVFKDADIDILKRKIENWYGVKLNYTNRPDRNWKFTSEYKNEHLENVLEGLRYSKNIEYVIENDSVTITFDK